MVDNDIYYKDFNISAIVKRVFGECVSIKLHHHVKFGFPCLLIHVEEDYFTPVLLEVMYEWLNLRITDELQKDDTTPFAIYIIENPDWEDEEDGWSDYDYYDDVTQIGVDEQYWTKVVGLDDIISISWDNETDD